MRPAYHYAPAANWLSDPNGLVHHAGEWHLFYQYNPHGEDWGHMSWGHAVSADLLTWEELSVALAEDERHMIFSGSAVIDVEDSAGFGKDAMVAIYTGHARSEPANQSQCLAYSADRGRSWAKYSGNPVIDRGMADFRDPNVFWHAATARWIMVVVLSNEQRGLIYASHDLKQWNELSVIHGANAPGEVWECPLLIELPVEGTAETRWLTIA
jgi:sucrose-6-phosphate hydrolase SacC (GH32 family)